MHNLYAEESGTGEKVDVRLPKTLVPVGYLVQIRPDIYTGNPETFGFNGTASVKFEVLEATNTIILHARSLVIDDADWVLMDSNMNPLSIIQSVQYDEMREFYILTLKELLSKGENYIVHLRQYSGPVDDSLLGIYWSSYQDGNNTE